MGHFYISCSAIPRRVLPIGQCARHALGSALPAPGNEIFLKKGKKRGGGGGGGGESTIFAQNRHDIF